MTAHENGRPAEAGTPVALVTGASLPPNAYPEDSLIALLREADENAYSECYVIADVAGDVGGSTAPVNYAPRWYAGHLGNGERLP